MRARAAISAEVTTSANPTIAGPRKREGTRNDV